MSASNTSAMTEASGLTNNQEGLENSSARPATRNRTNLRGSAEELAGRLRQMTVETPLRSLLAAFVLGVWFARRR